MFRRYLTFVASVSLLLLAACSHANDPAKPAGDQAMNPTGPPPTSVRFVTAVAPQSIEIAAGGSAEAVVHLTIQSGYHVNANPPTEAYLKATELSVPTADGISVGFITYPNAVTKKFAFADKPLAVYEGETAIKVMLKAASTSAKGAHTLAAKLNVQACDDKVCYAPGSIPLSLPVNIK
jgi:thioredoxin:protein disulfide reductase